MANRNHVQNNEEVRIVMVGKTGSGKSASGNTILSRQCFESKFSAKSLTLDCFKSRSVVDGQQVAVIDTPGLFDTRFGMDKTAADISQCISYAAPGPHVFLVVIRLGRYTQEEKQTVQKVQEIFGQAADRYSMVLFTGGDLLEGATVEDFLAESSELKELVDRCHGQYHVFNNKSNDRSQVSELLQKIRNTVQRNGGSHYTNEMFQEAERAIEEKKQRILKEKQEKIRREQEEIERRLQARFAEQMRIITAEHQAERERDRREAERSRETWEMERRQAERSRETWEMDQERKREAREIQTKKEWEVKEREMNEKMNALRAQHDQQLQEEKAKIQTRHVHEARKEAERFNPVHALLAGGAALLCTGNVILGGLAAAGAAIFSWFS